MFDKVKGWLVAIGGAIIAFLALLAGARKKKIAKLDKENKVKDIVINEGRISKNLESEHSEKISEIKDEASETIEAVRKDEKSYNDIIADWNNRT